MWWLWFPWIRGNMRMTSAYDWNYQGEAKAEAMPVPVTQDQEPSVEEHAQMIQKAFGKVLDKAMQHTQLSDRVKDLEDNLRALADEVENLRHELQLERVAHTETRNQLANVQATLSQRESTIHDLIQERDIVLGERNAAQDQRNAAQREAGDWQARYNEAEQKITALQGQYDTLLAQHTELQTKMEAFRNAFRGLAA